MRPYTFVTLAPPDDPQPEEFAFFRGLVLALLLSGGAMGLLAGIVWSLLP